MRGVLRKALAWWKLKVSSFQSANSCLEVCAFTRRAAARKLTAEQDVRNWDQSEWCFAFSYEQQQTDRTLMSNQNPKRTLRRTVGLAAGVLAGTWLTGTEAHGQAAAPAVPPPPPPPPRWQSSINA